MSALDMECPFCGSVPTEPCRTVRYAEPARSGVTVYGNYGELRALMRPHPERIAAARSLHRDPPTEEQR